MLHLAYMYEWLSQLSLISDRDCVSVLCIVKLEWNYCLIAIQSGGSVAENASTVCDDCSVSGVCVC